MTKNDKLKNNNRLFNSCNCMGIRNQVTGVLTKNKKNQTYKKRYIEINPDEHKVRQLHKHTHSFEKYKSATEYIHQANFSLNQRINARLKNSKWLNNFDLRC